MNNEVASLIKNINDDLYERKHFNRVDFINKYSQEKSELNIPMVWLSQKRQTLFIT